MKPICLIMGVLLLNDIAMAWGQKGHDVTCAIAERHLSKSARKQVSRILDGTSIVYWSSWMDNASHPNEYA